MEVSPHSLLEELIMAPKIDAPFPFPNEYFQNTWNFTPFDQTPDLHLPVTNNHPSLLELISPAADQFTNYPCPCPYEDDFQPFLDDLPPIQDLENDEIRGFLENCINGEIFSSYNNDDTPNMDIANVGTYSEKKSKSKKPDGQPSKNLMAERRRRKRLNDRLSMLRSIVPKISKMDRTSILGDTIDYMRELLDKIQKLREDENTTDQINLIGDYFKELKPNDTTQLRNPPKFDVERRNQDTKVDVCCAAKPGLLLSTVSTLDALGLDIQQCVISCFSDFSLQATCFEVGEHRSLVSSEDVKQALFRNAGYGGRCL